MGVSSTARAGSGRDSTCVPLTWLTSDSSEAGASTSAGARLTVIRRGGERKPHGGQRRAHAFAGFGDRLVRQADDIECHHARRELHLAVDIEHVDAIEGDGVDAGNHAIADR